MRLWQQVTIGSLIAVLLGSAGSLFVTESLDGWYRELNHPPGVPPDWVFGPVWTILYAMIGASAVLFARRGERGPGKRTAWIWFSLQAVLNLAWTPLFFGAHQLGVALADIAVLLVAIVVTIVLFRKREKTAGRLLIPYAAWVGYATYLNAGFWWLNR